MIGQTSATLQVRRRRLPAVAVLLFLGTVAQTSVSFAQERGQVFVSNYFGDDVTVYPLTASGDRAPQFVAFGALGDGPHQIAINHRSSELFVANNTAYSISVYDLSTGFLKRAIAGPSTAIVRPTGVAVDEVNGEVYVANDFGNSVTVYDVLASGDAPPKRTIASTSISQPVGIAIDLAHDEILVASYGINSIAAFDRLANGASVAAKRLISGGGLDAPQGIALDLARDEIFVANSSFSSPDAGSILVFRRSDNGFVEPIRRLQGSSTKLCNPISVAIDFLQDEIVVANSNFGAGVCAQSVTAYTRAATGDAAPTRLLSGPSTNLNYPTSAAVFYGSTVTVMNKALSASVTAGDIVGFNISATAHGGAILGLALTDTLPSGFAWSVSGPDASSCSLVGTDLGCVFGNLAKGESRSIRISAASTGSNCPGTTNQAAVSYNDGTAFLTDSSPVAKINVKCK